MVAQVVEVVLEEEDVDVVEVVERDVVEVEEREEAVVVNVEQEKVKDVMVEEKQVVDVLQEEEEEEPARVRKPRVKPDRNGFNCLGFIPITVLTARRGGGQTGRRGARLGLQLVRDLSCRICKDRKAPYTAHKRAGLRAHMLGLHGTTAPPSSLRTPKVWRPPTAATGRRLAPLYSVEEEEVVEREVQCTPRKIPPPTVDQYRA